LIQETLVIRQRNSIQAENGWVIVSAVETYPDSAKLVVGRPGLLNVEATLSVGDAVLFETPNGLFEVRVMSTGPTQVTVLVTQVSPRPGIAGGFIDQDSDNAPFTVAELGKIEESARQILNTMRARSDVSPEQLDFISRKLDDMQKASERMGRKDWMNLALGTLSSIIVTAAFPPDVAKALFRAAGDALTWLFNGGIRLLQ